MFIGHFGLGMGAKKVAPAISLGTLLLAAQFVDLLWPTFLILGWEEVAIQPGITVVNPLNFTYYPYTHSLLTGVFWGLLLGIMYYLFKKSIKGALVVGSLVLSHWFLDLLVHRPDLPLYPGSEIMAGFGLWNSIPGTLLLEGFLFLGGLYLYIKTTGAKNKIGIFVLWVIVSLLLLIYASNFFAPPPDSVQAIGWAGQLQWLFIGLGYWVDKHRSVKR